MGLLFDVSKGSISESSLHVFFPAGLLVLPLESALCLLLPMLLGLRLRSLLVPCLLGLLPRRLSSLRCRSMLFPCLLGLLSRRRSSVPPSSPRFVLLALLVFILQALSSSSLLSLSPRSFCVVVVRRSSSPVVRCLSSVPGSMIVGSLFFFLTSSRAVLAASSFFRWELCESISIAFVSSPLIQADCLPSIWKILRPNFLYHRKIHRVYTLIWLQITTVGCAGLPLGLCVASVPLCCPLMEVLRVKV